MMELKVLADLGTNHGGDIAVAKALLRDVKKLGAVPKVQLFSEQTWPRTWDKLLKNREFIPSVFRPTDLDRILPYKPAALKIASVESTYWDLVSACMATALPMIVSTGGMDETELSRLIDLMGEYDSPVCLMHCVSMYPTPASAAHMNRLAMLGDYMEDALLGWSLGWSSHVACDKISDLMTLATMAYCYGATVYEVHVGHIGKAMQSGGLDFPHSVTPNGLKLLMEHLTSLETMDGPEDFTGLDRTQVLKWRERWNRD